MSSSNIFGIPKYVEDDPEWLWFNDAENFEKISFNLCIPIDDYVAAIQEMLEVFPVGWARKVAPREVGYVGYAGIHPMAFEWLDFHPIARFITQKPYNAFACLAPIVRLGMDLIRTRHVPKIQTVRKELRSLEQYSGRLFELEILSTLLRVGLEPQILGTPDFFLKFNERAIFLEARHRGVPFWMNVASNIYMATDESSPAVRVEITYVSGVRKEASELCAEISAELKTMDLTVLLTGKPIVRRRYIIRHEPDAKPGTMIVGYGEDKPWATEIVNFVYRTLCEKRDQLWKVKSSENVCVLLIDCRSLLTEEFTEKSGVRHDWREQVKAGILKAGEKFLEENGWISGIIWFWRTKSWPINLESVINDPLPVSLSTISSHIEGLKIEQLVETLSKLTATD